MEQEDRKLLLRDLSARLNNGVRITWNGTDSVVCNHAIYSAICQSNDFSFKPCLRSLTSMTEEEKKEYCNLQDRFLLSSQHPVTDAYALFDWLNAHHFDYRGLIEKGLALEAPEGMYN